MHEDLAIRVSNSIERVEEPAESEGHLAARFTVAVKERVDVLEHDDGGWRRFRIASLSMWSVKRGSVGWQIQTLRPYLPASAVSSEVLPAPGTP